MKKFEIAGIRDSRVSNYKIPKTIISLEKRRKRMHTLLNNQRCEMPTSNRENPRDLTDSSLGFREILLKLLCLTTKINPFNRVKNSSDGCDPRYIRPLLRGLLVPGELVNIIKTYRV